jgi:acetate---CoA ligase (ADP-forming) subunit beta
MNSINIIEKAQLESRTFLNEIESKSLLSEAGIPVVETKLAKTPEEAVVISESLGFPVVLKVVSGQVIHKSDAGGVKLNLNNAQEVKEAYEQILVSVKAKYPQAVIDGISIQKMARPATEVVIGMTKDTQFGPVIMFGLGGILVEILKDVSFRIVPLEKEDARSMIKEIKGYRLLEGYRGTEAANVSVLEDLLLKISKFAENNPAVKEIDLNPLMAYKDSAVAVDARVIL